MEKMKYVEPQIEVTMLDSEDVITTSVVLPDDDWE